MLIAAILAGLTILVGTNAQPFPTIGDWLSDHNNKYRRHEGASNMAELVWDPDLEAAAQAWVDNCDYSLPLPTSGVGSYPSVGSNHGLSIILTLLNVTNYINNWISDGKALYIYASNTCIIGAGCDPYKRVVWATTCSLGCAMKFCDPVLGAPGASKGNLYACFYGPQGDVSGLPFIQGTACADCPNGGCNNDLCPNACEVVTTTTEEPTTTTTTEEPTTTTTTEEPTTTTTTEEPTTTTTTEEPTTTTTTEEPTTTTTTEEPTTTTEAQGSGSDSSSESESSEESSGSDSSGSGEGKGKGKKCRCKGRSGKGKGKKAWKKCWKECWKKFGKGKGKGGKGGKGKGRR